MPIKGDYSDEIPASWLEAEAQLDRENAIMLEDAINGRPIDPVENTRRLNFFTAQFSFWVAQERIWDAIKTNNEVGHYVEIKRLSTDKFVSAAAEREASYAVAKERYFRNRAEANMLKAQQWINTLKANQKAWLAEKGASTNGD
jgi:hypothetical protein